MDPNLGVALGLAFKGHEARLLAYSHISQVSEEKSNTLSLTKMVLFPPLVLFSLIFYCRCIRTLPLLSHYHMRRRELWH